MEKYNVLKLVQQKKEEDNAKTKYQKASKKKLEDLIGRRIRTTMIGALAAVEEKFQFLWKNEKGKPTEAQQKLAEIFQELRRHILDNGNDQIRGVEKDLEYFIVEIKKLHLEFKLDNKEGN